ncbi:hypothetical protein EIP86_006600, partial [Pleurotus ostreatoroseus]
MSRFDGSSKKSATLRRARTMEGGLRTDWIAAGQEQAPDDSQHLDPKAVGAMSLVTAREELRNLHADLKATKTSSKPGPSGIP